MMAVKFQCGQLVATPGALEAFQQAGESPLDHLRRHLSGDWGDLDEGVTGWRMNAPWWLA